MRKIHIANAASRNAVVTGVPVTTDFEINMGKDGKSAKVPVNPKVKSGAQFTRFFSFLFYFESPCLSNPYNSYNIYPLVLHISS